MAKQKVRATRHNGRKGENGVFKAGHNDRSFDVDAAEHIDSSRSFMNVYWDMYKGYIIADESCRTKTPGVFTAGDCRTKEVRQLTTAAADGSVAALAACSYIDNME